jgi:hypothetical protein
MSGFPFNIGITGSDLPLSGNPYWSRVTLSLLKGMTANNYVLLGFRPGFPLQASELNEIQEISMLNQTLTQTMISSWPMYLPSNPGIIYGPGWNGITPLYPAFDVTNTSENLVGKTGGQVIIRKGWYLVAIKSSGLKHWIYLNQGYTAAIPSTGSGQQLGFIATYQTVNPQQDPSLYDNSTGTTIITGAAAGAERIKVNLSSPMWIQDGNTANFSPILKKIDTSGLTLNFMNNFPVSQE